MLRIDVSAGSAKYPIYIEHGLTAQLGRLVEQAKPGARHIFISSPLVWKLHGKALRRAMPRTEPLLLPDGERYKQPLGKHLIGAVYHPAFAAAVPVLLETLPRREFRAGLYEVIKYGMTSSRDLFDRVSRQIDAVFAKKPDVLVPMIGEACSIK